MITIDGSIGEGGGQVLRSSLALSMALGVPFRITRIRAGRAKPGLMRQHLTAVEAAAAICSATVEGAAPGSQNLTFTPDSPRAGDYSFTVGTAGSTTLVLQAILPALMLIDGPSTITIHGGTHARWAPPFDFFARALIPQLRRTGISIEADLNRHGFYPAGGGCITVRVHGTPRPAPLRLETRGEILRRRATVILAKLPPEVAKRELGLASLELGLAGEEAAIEWVNESHGPGNVLLLEVHAEHASEVICALGEQGKPAEQVAREAVADLRRYLDFGAPVGEHLADQLMTPLAAVAARTRAESSFITGPLSQHARTNSTVIAQFLGREPEITPLGDERFRWNVR